MLRKGSQLHFNCPAILLCINDGARFLKGGGWIHEKPDLLEASHECCMHISQVWWRAWRPSLLTSSRNWRCKYPAVLRGLLALFSLFFCHVLNSYFYAYLDKLRVLFVFVKKWGVHTPLRVALPVLCVFACECMTYRSVYRRQCHLVPSVHLRYQSVVPTRDSAPYPHHLNHLSSHYR